jgi:hypothetical protein
MEATDSSETPVPVCHRTSCHTPADPNLNIYHSENFEPMQISVHIMVIFRKVLAVKNLK